MMNLLRAINSICLGPTSSPRRCCPSRPQGIHLDIERLEGRACAGGLIPGDFNGDGVLDADDLAQWQGDFGVNDLSDADNDGDSDGGDFLVWQQQLGSVPAVPVAGAVPEPAAWRLAAWVLVAIAARRRRVTV